MSPNHKELCIVANAYNRNTWEGEAGGLMQAGDQHGLHSRSQASVGYRVRPSQSNQMNSSNKKNTNYKEQFGNAVSS